MRFGVRMPAHHPIREVIATVRRAEAAGFDAAWFPDSHLNYREVWTTLGAVAVSTDRIQIGPTVTNLVSRHVTVTASAARAVSEAAPGRFLTSGIQCSPFGMPSVSRIVVCTGPA